MMIFDRMRTFDDKSIEGELIHLIRMGQLVEKNLVSVDVLLSWFRKGFISNYTDKNLLIERLDIFQRSLNKLNSMMNTVLLECQYELRSTDDKKPQQVDERYYTSTELTSKLKVDRSTVKKWFDRGEFPNFRQKSKKIKEIPYRDMKVFLDKHPKYKDVFFNGENE